jgi:TolA-binding protein
MGESMAFVGGVAVAGLAALVLVKGTGNPIQPNFAVAPQMPATVMASPGMPPSGYYQPYINPQSMSPISDQRVELESLKAQMERLKSDNEQLKIQNQQLQWQFLSQQQQSQLFTQQTNQKSALQPENGWWSSPILWLVGGVTLTVGGGVVVAGILALFSPRQRTTRTVKLIHPYQGATPPLMPARRAKFLPHHSETRRMENAEYDEMR